MKSETLRHIKTMRQVKSSLEIAGQHKFKTTGTLFKPPAEIEHLETVGQESVKTQQILAREKLRAAKFEASVEKSQRKLLKSRENLAVVINRNRALTNLRHQIQKERDRQPGTVEQSPPAGTTLKVVPESLGGIEHQY
jgi:hypothetical protein